MIERMMLLSQICEGQEEALFELLRSDPSSVSWLGDNHNTQFVSIYRYGKLLLVYVEHNGKISLQDGFWNENVRLMLLPFPGALQERYEIRLNDIFHDDEPSDDVPWRRPGYRPKRRVGSLAQLKPEMYASYVFLHYQLQEEKPRQFNKYYMIGSFGQYIFSYQELPEIVEVPRKGKLGTNNTPQDWEEAMYSHFELWTDTKLSEQLWLVLEEIVSVELI